MVRTVATTRRTEPFQRQRHSTAVASGIAIIDQGKPRCRWPTATSHAAKAASSRVGLQSPAMSEPTDINQTKSENRTAMPRKTAQLCHRAGTLLLAVTSGPAEWPRRGSSPRPHRGSSSSGAPRSLVGGWRPCPPRPRACRRRGAAEPWRGCARAPCS